MLYVLILAFVLTCVSCGETHALSFSARTNKEGLSARTNEDSGPLDPSRRWLFGLVSGVISIVSGSRTMGCWKRGSTDGEPERFKVILHVNPCAFDIYDANGDDMITRDELEAIFGDSETTRELALALDKSGDGQVDEKEFKEDMHRFVEGC